MWFCPHCGRQFRKKGQWHSCVSYAVDDHFEGKPPRLREAFERLMEAVRSGGPVRITAVKSMITIAAGWNFSVVHPRKNYFYLEFVLRRELNHPRIHKVQQYQGGRVIHLVRISGPDEIDAELMSWIQEARAAGKPGQDI